MTTNPGILRLAPHSPEAEEAVIGSVLTDPDLLPEIAAFLKADAFHINRLALVWDAMLRLLNRAEAVDILTVAEELRAMGKAEQFEGKARGFLVNLINRAPTHVHGATYARVVERLAVRRRMLTLADEIKTLAYDETEAIDRMEGVVQERMDRVFAPLHRKGAVHIGEAGGAYFEQVEATQNMDEDTPTGLPTGFADFDNAIDGFQAGSLNFLGARPKMGKTALMGQIAINVAKRKPKDGPPPAVYIWTGEMPIQQVIERLLASEASDPRNDLRVTPVGTHMLRRGLRKGGMKAGSREWQQFVKAIGDLGNLPIFINDQAGITPRELEADINYVKSSYPGGIGLIVVDYLQLMAPGVKKPTREQEVSYLAEQAKLMAMDIAPVLAAVQLSRKLEDRQDKRPIPSDMRDSGALEQYADMATFLYRDVVYNDATEFPSGAEWNVALNRHGPTGSVMLHFEKSVPRFADAKTTRIDLSEL